MSFTEIASFIGAAAWIYPIYVEAKKRIIKTKIEFFPVDQIELGYTTFGPIINIQGAISAEKKDAFITRIELKIKHEQGESHILTWKTLDEIQVQIRSFSGEGGTIEKSQPATVIKVNTTIPVEKKIGFWDSDYQKNSQEILNRLIKKISFMKQTRAEFNIDNIFQEEEFVDLNNYFINRMYWKSGSYELNILIYLSSYKEPFVKEYIFHLDNANIDLIKANAYFLKRAFKAVEPNAPKVTWNWVYPKIIEKTAK